MVVALGALVLLHGVVMRGPTQPVCQVGTPCSAPAAHVRLVFVRGGGVAARVRTDGAGRYAVRLARGTYAVRVAPALRIGRGIAPATVTVRSPRRLDFFVDTGIR